MRWVMATIAGVAVAFTGVTWLLQTRIQKTAISPNPIYQASCPSCGAEAAYPPRLIRTKTKCTKCGKEWVFPDPAKATSRYLILPGIMIATRAGGRELDDPAYEPLWAAADEAGAIVYLHPGFGGTSTRYRDFGLVNGLGRLEDTTVTLARLLYAGIPAKWPHVKFVIAHGGAALPYVLGRLVRNHTINAETTMDPLDSFSRLYFDSVVFDPDALRFLVTKVGADKVLLGSDYPFPIGDLQPRNILAALPAADRETIESGTRRLLAGGRS